MNLGPARMSAFGGMEDESLVHDFTIPWTSVVEFVVSRWVDVNGVRTHFLESGGAREDSPVLLMVHGWAGSAVDWERLMPLLPPGVRAIAVDLPGCGLSDKPDAAYDMPFFIDAILSFCESLGVSRMVLAGHSMGGQIAVHFTSRYPERVEKLILIDPAGLKGEEGGLAALARLGPVVDLALQLNTRFFIEWAMRANILHDAPPDLVASAVEGTATSILGQKSARAISRITQRVIGREHVDELLPGVSQETLLIWGDADRLLSPRWADEYVSRLRRASVHPVAGAGHMPMFEKPEAVAALIADFIAP